MDAHALVHPRWRVSLADDVRVADRYGGDATPRLRKMRAIIAVLVCAPGHHIARRELTALLWSDRAPEQARASLRQCLFVLRAKVPSLVEADGEKVWLVDGAVELADADPEQAGLAQLAGLDPAFDRWLAKRCRDVPAGVAAVLPISVTGDGDAPHRMRRWPMVAVSGALMIAALAAVWWQRRLPPSPPGVTIIALAPFAAAPDTPAARAVAERMSDDIRALLPADRTVVRVSHVAGDGPQQASRMAAEWIISGSVEARDGAGRARVQIETADGRQIWGRDVEAGRIADAAAIAATRIAMATGCALGGPRVHRDADVLSLLFAACERLDFSADNYNDEMAMVALQRLAERAPDDALAQAYFGTGLAVTAVNMPPAIAKAQRFEAVRRLDRAQRLDPRVGEAWLGRFALIADDRAYALKEAMLARGLAVEPNNFALNVFMGHLLADVGRGTEALVVGQRAMALAPALLATTQLTAGILSDLNRPREALVLLDMADRRFPGNHRQALHRLDALLASGNASAARALLDDAAKIPGFLEPEREAAKRRLSYAMDQPHGALADAEARVAIAEVEAKPELALRAFEILTQLGRTDAARVLALRYPLPTDVFFRLQSRPVLLDARFPLLAQRAGLWDYWQRSGHWPDVCRDPQVQWRCGAGVKSASFSR